MSQLSQFNHALIAPTIRAFEDYINLFVRPMMHHAVNNIAAIHMPYALLLYHSALIDKVEETREEPDE